MKVTAEKKKTILALKGFNCDNCMYKTQTKDPNCKYRVKRPSYDVCGRWSKKYEFLKKSEVDRQNLKSMIDLYSRALSNQSWINFDETSNSILRMIQSYTKAMEDEDQ